MASKIQVGINGFGRIGKLATRVAEGGDSIEVVAINDPFMSVADIVYSLKYDSVHGRFDGTIVAGETDGTVVLNGREVRVTSVKDPKEADWASAGVSIVVDCSGVFKELDTAQAHLDGGAQKVVISAPSKTAPMFVFGVNADSYDGQDIVSNASCTTNCLAPLVKVIDQAFGIEEALATTVHACTATQRIVDLNNSKKHRLGRSGLVNIIPSTTGAAAATAKVYPPLTGKITGMALRVPTPDVSVVDVTIRTSKATSLEEINAAMEAAAAGPMAGVLEVATDEIVSSDCYTNPHSCIFDPMSSLSVSDTFFKLIAFYDNEWGYSNRLMELVALVASK